MIVIWYLLVISSLCQFSSELLSGSGEEEIPYSHVFLIDCNPDNVTCDSKSLEDIATEIANETGNATENSIYLTLKINITAESVELRGIAEFRNLQSLIIQSEKSEILCTKSNSSLYFQFIQNIVIENITVRGCGSSLKGVVKSAVHFITCYQIKLENVGVVNSTGSGLNIFRNQGNVSVTNSKFMENSILDNPNDFWGGNGVNLLIQDISTKSFTFENCEFLHNKASGYDYSFIFSLHNTSMMGKGRGGGMRITMKSNVTDVTVTLNNCTFTGNSAYIGGGLSARIEGGGYNNKLLINNTEFSGNGCDKIASGGGGAYLSFENLKDSGNASTNYAMSITNVIFENNCAEIGGGVYFYPDHSTVVKENYITFENCLWEGNFAHTGSAINFAPSIFSRTRGGHLPTPEFIDCSFINNSVRNDASYQRQSYGSGTLYSSLINIKFKSKALFENNLGSGIIIVNGRADFVDAHANFTSNVGIQGGAILMIGASSMVVGAGQRYIFEKNHATDKGGAIYVNLIDQNDFVASRSCFLQYRDKSERNTDHIISSKNWTASLIFRENSASNLRGNSIYATSVRPCQVVRVEGRYQIINKSEDIFKEPGIVLDGVNQTSTEGSQFKINNMELRVIPGEVSSLGVSVLDDFDNDVDVTMVAYIREKEGKEGIEVDSDFSCTVNQKIRFRGRENVTGKLVIQTLGSRKLSTVLNVTLLECPPGFMIRDDVCTSNKHFGIARYEELSSYLIEGYWAGYVHRDDGGGKEFATSFCPLGFCNYNRSTNSNVSKEFPSEVRLPRDGSKLDEAVCGTSRTGVFCSECRENYSIFYHSPSLSCREFEPYFCKFGWIFYILSELIPVTILFVVVLALNISFTTGAVNGFILFSQVLGTLVIDATGIIQYHKSTEIFVWGYEIIYGFLNFKFFEIEHISFCIWPNATVLGMLTFRYVTIVYALLLVLSMIIFMRYCAPRCFGRYYSITLLRNSVIHGLSGFFVLCYGQCISVSFTILYSEKYILQDDINSSEYSPNRVWFSGNVIFMSRRHLQFALPAIFFLLTIGVIPPLILIGYPSLNKVLIFLKLENTSAVHYINRASKLKPLLDSIQGSFKDDFRFFAGIYFFYRWMACTTYALVSSLMLFYSLTQVLLILMLVVHAICQPYQKRWHNVLDTLLLADLVIINALSAIHYYRFRLNRGMDNSIYSDSSTTVAIQVVFIYLPLVYITIYIIVHAVGKFCARKEQEKEEYVLKKIKKKIYRSSFIRSQHSESIVEESLPYRLVGKEDEDPFEESKAKESIVHTYF